MRFLCLSALLVHMYIHRHPVAIPGRALVSFFLTSIDILIMFKRFNTHVRLMSVWLLINAFLVMPIILLCGLYFCKLVN